MFYLDLTPVIALMLLVIKNQIPYAELHKGFDF